MKLPFYITKRIHGYDFSVTPHSFEWKDMTEEMVDGLMDIEISFIESHGCYMGGSPYSFFVEQMKKSQAEALRDIILYFFESHKKEVAIEYTHSYR